MFDAEIKLNSKVCVTHDSVYVNLWSRQTCRQTSVARCGGAHLSSQHSRWLKQGDPHNMAAELDIVSKE